MRQELPERKWEPTKKVTIKEGGVEKEIQLYASRQRSCKTQCKCGVWVKDQEGLDNHILSKI